MSKGILYIFLIFVLSVQCVHSQTWLQYRDSADMFSAKEDVDSAIKYYILSREKVSTEFKLSEAYIQLLMDVAKIYYQKKNQYAAAENFYIEARNIIRRKQGVNNNLYATNANFLGQVNYKLIKYNRAEEFYIEAKLIWEKLAGKNTKESAASCNMLGILYNDWGRYDKAEALHLEARAIREELFTKESNPYAQSCNNLGVIYWNLGQYDKAEPLALEAKEIRGRVAGIPRRDYSISCVNLANIYRDMGKYDQAIPLYIEAREIRSEAKFSNDYALSCSILADLYYYMKEYEKAEPLYLEAKGIFEKISPVKTSNYAQSCSDLSQFYRETGKYDKAAFLAMEANQIWEGIGDDVRSELAINNNSLGALYFIMGENEKAEKYFIKARNEWGKNLGEDHPYYTSNTLSLAKVYWSKDEISKANDFYIKAFDSQKKQADKLFSFTSEEEKQLYLKNIIGAEDEFQSFYFDNLRNGNSGQPYSISLQKRNQILSSSLQLRQMIYTSNDSLLSKKYDAWVAVKKQIAALYSKGEKAPEGQLKQAIEKADRLEKDLVKNSTDFKKVQQPAIDWKAIQQSLKSNEAAIEFVEFNYFNGKKNTDSILYVALLLKKDADEPEMIPLFEKKQFDSLMNSKSGSGIGINLFYSRGIEIDAAVNLPFQLYNTIWKPLETKLDGIETVYFAPAGLLHRVSFAAIQVDSSVVLSDKFRLIQLSTTANITNKLSEVIKENDRIELFGGVNYQLDTTVLEEYSETRGFEDRSGFNYLPGTELEVKEIAKAGVENHYSLKVTKGFAATEKSIKELNGKQSPKILHIATHGFFFSDPEVKKNNTKIKNADSSGIVFRSSANPLFRSGLLFAGANDAWMGKAMKGQEDDGILTAYEVSNLFLPNTSLVVLSACETALGDIKGSEGVYGLQRSFKMAGVQNLVMSLWKVPDAETAEFMQLFYKNLFGGKEISNSFYQAQETMKNKYKKEPYNWAAWILVR